MTPEQFISLWKDNTLTERGGAQAHFDDLCELLEVDKPRDPDNYCFERGAKKTGGGDPLRLRSGQGWADVWKRGCFGWENKKPGRNLDTALKQLTDYARQLENPPLLVVSDRERIIIHTAFTGYPDEPREIRIEQLADPATLQLLRWVFTDPHKLRPEKSTAAITEAAAGQFAAIAKSMRQRGLDGQQVAHFLVQCLFCMFAEDEHVLPANILTDLLKNAGNDTDKAARRIATLFAAMEKNGGEYGDHDIAWFNGGLFKTIDVPPLTVSDLAALYSAASDMDWRAIDPTIFGTLFERGLDPSARAPLGAHYTDTGTIAKLIKPLITEPLLAEWLIVKAVIAAGFDKKPGSKGFKDARVAYHGFLERLRLFRVLDPACGSGNFLYLALKALRDVEKQVNIEAQEFGFAPELMMQTGPHNICGIEINEFAAELARVTVWIGDIQWCHRNGREIARNPILRTLDSIEHRDALLTANPPQPPFIEGGSVKPANLESPPSIKGDLGGFSEATWPPADVIVGNPPFLGGSKMLGELGEEYVSKLRKCYDGRVPGGADLVTYWFEKARAQVEAGKAVIAGFVATNSIRGGSNREVLKRICASGRIFNAWSDEPWINNGAAVRVSLVCFEGGEFVGAIPAGRPGATGYNAGLATGRVTDSPLLNGEPVAEIYADLTASADTAGLDLTTAIQLVENAGICIKGTEKGGPFDIPGELGRKWLSLPHNPNNKPNSSVVRPWANGMDVTRCPSDTWIIDFHGLGEDDAALFEAPFEYTLSTVKSARLGNREARTSEKWWLHRRSGEELRKALAPLSRYIATPRVAKHRLFVWMSAAILPDSRLYVIASDSDTTFGILHSRIHQVWSLKTCSWHGVGNDPTYNAASCFETYPFPVGAHCMRPPLTFGEKSTNGDDSDMGACHAPLQNPHSEAIATAARRLVELRDNWLNPTEWVDWVITPEEEKADYPKRPVAKPSHEADLKKRTLTNLYNTRPAWLDNAHRTLDKAVATAYDWNDYTPEMADETILGRLLALNLERAKE
jgi:type II restriction/modification system DNA methylase subunit YeeA